MYTHLSRLVALLLVGCSAWTSTVEAQKTAQLAPDTTKAFLVVPDAPALSTAFDLTEFGDLAKDPVIKPFADDVGKQLESKLAELDTRLGITLADLSSVAAGEMAVAIIQPENNPKLHAVAVMVDATGKPAQVKALQAKIAADMAARKAATMKIAIGNVEVTKYKIPPAKGEVDWTYAYHCEVNQWLFATDHQQELTNILGRLGAPGTNALSTVASFTTIMPLVSVKENANPHLQWYVEPFGYSAVLRASSEKKRKGKNVAEILKQNGFDAIRGLGGAVNFRKQHAQVVHRSFVLADAGATAPRLQQGAKILQLPARPHKPVDWIPENVATALTLNWKINEAFDVLGILFNAFQGPKFWEELVDGLENEKKGPRINLKRDLIRHLEERGVMITRPKLPITVHSEERIFAMESNNPRLLERSLFPALDRDPTFKRIEGLKGVDVVVWRHTPRDEKQRRPPRRGKGGAAGGRPNPFLKPGAANNNKPTDPPRALAIKYGYLMYSTSEELLMEVLRGGYKPLKDHADAKEVEKELIALGAGVESLRYFTRLESSQLANYELLKMGMMPKSKTLLGQLLNKLFEPDEKGVERKQQIDASKLPAFPKVAKYLGLGGIFARELPNGWEITGAFLRKAPKANLGP